MVCGDSPILLVRYGGPARTYVRAILHQIKSAVSPPVRGSPVKGRTITAGTAWPATRDLYDAPGKTGKR
jgi:hypothetical protein